MRYEEERTIYMIKPEFLLDDVVRALRKLGLNPLLEEEPGGWLVEAAGSGKHVKILLTSEIRCLKGLEVFGPVPAAYANDVNAALVGEARLGAGRAVRDVVMLALGTGVGGAVMVAGRLVTDAARAAGVALLPVDSEHNAIHQALRVGPAGRVKRLILTASGGPFRTWPVERIQQATLEETLNHPTWKMGPKITVDSATMMNKGLEIIEAHHLFKMPSEAIDVVIHPQSLVHSLVEYIDGTLMAQLSVNDMRFPILYALAWPDRLASPLPGLDLVQAARLTFEAPDPERFPALRLAREALEAGGEMPAVMNAANEEVVAAFLEGRCAFPDISRTVEVVMELWTPRNRPLECLDQALEADRCARNLARENL